MSNYIVACSTDITNCEECSDATTCTKCAVGFAVKDGSCQGNSYLHVIITYILQQMYCSGVKLNNSKIVPKTHFKLLLVHYASDPNSLCICSKLMLSAIQQI